MNTVVKNKESAMRKSRQPSIGDAISTFSFILFGLLLGIASLETEETLKSGALAICSCLSLTAALRFRIERLVSRLRK